MQGGFLLLDWCCLVCWLRFLRRTLLSRSSIVPLQILLARGRCRVLIFVVGFHFTCGRWLRCRHYFLPRTRFRSRLSVWKSTTSPIPTGTFIFHCYRTGPMRHRKTCLVTTTCWRPQFLELRD